MFKLENKKFLITGASGGIGQAIVKVMHNAGATLCISGTKQEALEEIAQQYERDVHILTCDLSNTEEVLDLVNKAQVLLEGFDGLVCNAGVTQDNLLLRMTNDAWQKVIDINLTSTFYLNRSACKVLMKNKWGRIVNISSVVGLTGNIGQANYAASKAGLIAMSKSIAKEFAGRNITINCVAPGFIKTRMTANLNEIQQEKILNNIPMKRIGSPEEIGVGVLFLASKEAQYITGHVLNINGGMFM
ncbi:MAG: 3-oxoacyl-[acyl-carrier-protein] reductase [Wolbachia endosymbiont of Fragariocoptes setiger]|nr:3-oxoacyl-[acyl-carrier-protein] reductase [Wolbachia endosymbiont of Fragariocoptes setiger]